MINFKLIIKGNCIVKKNTTGEQWYYTKKLGGGATQKIPLNAPIKYYKKAYTDWAKEAVQTLIIFKNDLELGKIQPIGEIQYPDKLPITDPVFFTCMFFVDRKTKIDLTNLLEAPQDVLTGNAGNFLDKTRTIDKKKHKIKFDHSKYQIIEDDNYKFIPNLGGSRILYDPSNPRTEIFISSFNDKKYGEIFNMIHPGLVVSSGVEDQTNLFDEDIDLNKWLSD